MNLALLATALVLGCGTGWILWSISEPVSWRSVIWAGCVGALATVVVSVLAAIAARSPFNAVHMAYLVGVVSVPLTATIGLARSWFTSSRPSLPIYSFMLFAAVVPIGVGIYATHIEPFWLRVDRATLTTDAEHRGLRIAVLSDVQTTEIGDYENRAIDALIAEQPDIVLIAGDFYQLPAGQIEMADKHQQFAGALQRLGQNVEHVVMVNGNTDRPWVLRSLAEGSGVSVLDNEIIELTIRDSRVMVGGISLFADDTLQDQVVDRLLTADDDTFTILLGHKPDEVRLLPAGRGVDLVAAGHTHGGQISIPFFGPPLTLTSVPRNVAAGGLHTLDGQAIYVSTGVGRERGDAPQMRLGVRPSFGIITTER